MLLLLLFSLFYIFFFIFPFTACSSRCRSMFNALTSYIPWKKKALNTCSHCSLWQIEYAICSFSLSFIVLFIRLCCFAALLFQVFITNLKFQFSQSNESFKLICPLDFTACKFCSPSFPLPHRALFVHLLVALSTWLRSISPQQQQQRQLGRWKISTPCQPRKTSSLFSFSFCFGFSLTD